MEVHFDRGSLVIVSGWPPGGHGPSGLPAYFLWDPRVNRWRAEGYRLAAFRAWLHRRGIFSTYRSSRPREFLPAPRSAERLPRLRPYQLEALQAWTAAGRRGVISLPTGSGKTRVALCAMLRLGRPALVLAPTRQLIHQWVRSIREFYDGPVGEYGDGKRDVQPFTVATYESGYIHLDRLGDHFDLLVVDEAHHFASERLGEIARMATAPFRLGLSATLPGAGSERKAIEGLLGPICFSLPTDRLTGSYLSTFEIRVVRLRLSREERAEYNHHRGKFLLHARPFFIEHAQASWLDFVRAASRSPAGREALTSLRRSREVLSLPRAKRSALDQLLDLHADQPTLVFTADNQAAYEISRSFLVPAITCEIDRAERERVLDRFQRGIYRALVSARVLNEGIDVPDASVAIVAGGSSSPVEHTQRIGRVLRPAPGKKALVYELVMAGTGDLRAWERRNISVVSPSPPPL